MLRRSPVEMPRTGRTFFPNATLVRREDVTAAIALFRVRPDAEPPAFIPGQYLALGLRIGDASVQRPYSTASGPGTDALEFLVRRVPGGTFTPALWAAPLGTRLTLGRPKGMFTLKPDDDRTHMFIATGTGIAPFVGMLDVLEGRQRMPRVIIIHGVAQVPELAFRGRLARAHANGTIRYVPTISRPADQTNAGWGGRSGRVTDVLPALFGDGAVEPGRVIAYVCGNPGMVESARSLLGDLGLPSDGIVAERYWALDPA